MRQFLSDQGRKENPNLARQFLVLRRTRAHFSHDWRLYECANRTLVQFLAASSLDFAHKQHLRPHVSLASSLSLSLSATLLMASFISLSLSAETEVRCVLQETKAAVALEDLYCPSWWKALQVTHEVKAISFSLTAAWRWRETAAVTYEFVREWWGRTWVRRISLEQGLPPSLSSLTSCGSGLNASPHFTLFYTRETD